MDALHLSSSIFGGMIFDRKIVQAVLLSFFHPALLYQGHCKRVDAMK